MWCDPHLFRLGGRRALNASSRETWSGQQELGLAFVKVLLMKREEFERGAEWAYRVERAPGLPVRRVQLLKIVRQRSRTRVQVRFPDDSDGCDEWVSTNALICSWNEWPVMQEDERREVLLRAYVREHHVDETVREAADWVLQSTGEHVNLGTRERGYAEESPEALDRIGARARVIGRPWLYSPAFTNRKGLVLTPNDYLVDLAVNFAKAEPQSVVAYIDVSEAELVARSSGVGEAYWFDYVLKQKPAWAVARQWAGASGESAQQWQSARDEVRRLRWLVQYAITTLLRLGHEAEAKRLARELGDVE